MEKNDECIAKGTAIALLAIGTPLRTPEADEHSKPSFKGPSHLDSNGVKSEFIPIAKKKLITSCWCSMNANRLRMLAAVIVALWVTSLPVLASEMDDKIASSAKDSYVFKTYLNSDDVKVDSKEGIVTLSGTVNDQSHKGLAQETVANLPGVTSVDNRLELKADHPAERTNEWLAMKVKAALLFHRNVSLANTQVHVEEGIVTLRGEAADEAQKMLTTEYANVDGSREVKNEMTVATAPKQADQTMKEKIDDASITAQVKMALLTNRSTSALKTSVATKDGIVTLGGKAKNVAEKDLATKLVSDIHGVNSVVNNMAQG